MAGRRVGRLAPYATGSPGSFATQVRKLTGVEGLHVHQMRHTFAGKWLERSRMMRGTVRITTVTSERGCPKMKRMVAIVIAAAWAIVIVAANAQAGRPTVVRMLTQSLGKLTATVAVRQVNADEPFAGDMWGGDAAGPVGTAVAELAVLSDTTAIWIPLSAFVDLGDPRTIALQRKGRGVLLLLNGGETGTSYLAQFYIERDVLRWRRVNHREMPDAWEETRYGGKLSPELH